MSSGRAWRRLDSIVAARAIAEDAVDGAEESWLHGMPRTRRWQPRAGQATPRFESKVTVHSFSHQPVSLRYWTAAMLTFPVTPL